MNRTFFFSLYFLCFSIVSISQNKSNLSKRIDSLFKKYITQELPGASVVVIKNGKVVHKNSYGLANLEHQIPLNNNSVFDIASVSKQFVGHSIAKLIFEKKISLNDDVKTYIPEFPDFGPTITIRHLLYHQSGLRDWPATLKLAGVQFNDVLTFEQILNMIYQQKDLNFVPGSKYIYSNTGYNVLVEVIQRITKQSFRDWTSTHIFEPLKMTNTFFKDNHKEVIKNQVNSYYKEDDKIFFDPNNLIALGSSSLQTTINDLAKWLQYLDSEKGQKYVSLMQQQGKLNSGESTVYAFGIEIDNYKGLKRLSHDGGWASFNTYLAYLPEQHFSIAVLFNRPSWPQGFAQKIMDMSLKEHLKSEAVNEDNSDPKPEVFKKNLKLNAKTYVGTYFLEQYMSYVTITEEDGKLYSQATDEDKQVMIPVSKTQFWVEAYSSSIFFNIDKNSIAESITYHRKISKKMVPIKSSSTRALQAFVGTYLSKELNTVYDVRLKDGKLYLSHVRNGKIDLKRIWNDGFETGTEFAPFIEFQRDTNGKVLSFTATHYRSRNQKFTKTK